MRINTQREDSKKIGFLWQEVPSQHQEKHLYCTANGTLGTGCPERKTAVEKTRQKLRKVYVLTIC